MLLFPTLKRSGQLLGLWFKNLSYPWGGRPLKKAASSSKRVKMISRPANYEENRLY